MNKKGNLLLIILIAVGVAAAVILIAAKNGYKIPGITDETETKIVDASGLDSAAKELDGTDLNQMDPDINQLGTDASSF